MQRYRREKSSACLALPSLLRKGTPPGSPLVNDEHREHFGSTAAAVLEERRTRNLLCFYTHIHISFMRHA